MTNEQTLNFPTTDPVLVDKEAVSYGKFKSKEDMINAYNSLETEFTKRSQRLKELEGESNVRAKQQEEDTKWDNRYKELTTKYPIASELTEQMSEVLDSNKDIVNYENCLELALLQVLAQGYQPKPKSDSTSTAKTQFEQVESREQIIAEYINGFKHNVPEQIPRGGEIPLALPQKPKSISEAGKFAINLINSIKE